MNSPTSEETTEKSLTKSAADSEARNSEEESTKSTQTGHSKVGIDAERIRSSIARLTSNSTDELEKLIAELERLQEFLKSETGRVQREISTVLDGIGLLHGKPREPTAHRIRAQMGAINLSVGLDRKPQCPLYP